MSDIQWTVSGGGAQPVVNKKKVPYTSKYRIKDDTPSDQRRTMERWNEMIDALKENGLMEEK